MARVTVDDCLEKINDRFKLVLVAAKRTHQLNSGSYKSVLDDNKDKSSVLALREIAEGIINESILEKDYELNPYNEFIEETNEENQTTKKDIKLAQEIDAELSELIDDTKQHDISIEEHKPEE